MSSQPWTLYELITASIARSLRDGDVGFTGLTTGGPAATFATVAPLVAMELARRTHAPNLTILLAGWSHNPNLSKLSFVPNSEFAPALRELECDAQMIDYPGQWSVKRGDVDVGFSSGAQVDVQGNLNAVCIGDYHRPKVRLVGPIFQPEHLALFRREIIMMPHHDRRNFVQKVDFVSGVGYPGGLEGRKALGLEWGGPELVMTPKCIFDFDKERGRMRVKSIHPGVTPEEVRQNTGFDLGNLSGLPVTEEPTEDQLRIIREEIDPRGILLPRG